MVIMRRCEAIGVPFLPPARCTGFPYDSRWRCAVRRIKTRRMSGSSIGQFAGFWRCLHLAWPETMVARLPVTFAYKPHPGHITSTSAILPRGFGLPQSVTRDPR